LQGFDSLIDAACGFSVEQVGSERILPWPERRPTGTDTISPDSGLAELFRTTFAEADT